MDPSGAVVPNATVSVIDPLTNAKTTSVTDSTGDYSVPFLKPSAYDIHFSAKGFKEFVQTGVKVQLSLDARINVIMQVGEGTDSVSVSSEASQINYENPEISHVLGTEQMENVPLVTANSRGRQVQLLSKLIPGVVSTSSNNSNTNNFSFAGGRPVTNDWLVDGIPTTNPSDETFTFTPSPDSIQEFKAISVPFSAEYGHTGGGVVLLTSKSGTNSYHGYTYDYFRNRVLNARNFFQPVSTVKYVQNDPGIDIGGPVLLPRYSGRDKTFFFVDFNSTISSNGNSTSGLVPTQLERNGDFSQSLNSKGALIRIYDPLTSQLSPDGKTYTRQQFPGNVIPASRIDSVGKAVMGYYPLPNAALSAANFFTAPPKPQEVWQGLVRLDQNFRSDDKGFFRFGRYNPNSTATQLIPNKANTDTSGGFRDTQVVLGETHVFGPHIVNDLRIGFVQEVNYTYNDNGAVPELGLKGVNLSSFPTVSVSGYLGLGASNTNHDRDRSYMLNEGLHLQAGRHTIKMGGDFRRQMYNNYNPGKLSGSYSFGPTFSALPTDATTGTPLADLLLGFPATTTINITDYTLRLNNDSSSVYIQDDWKVTNRLTVNLGLRNEWNGVYTEANGQFSSLNPKLANRFTGNPGDVQFTGKNGAPNQFTPDVFVFLLPRLGVAWNFAQKTVFRGGYGLYRLPSIGYSGFGTKYTQYGVNTTFQSTNQNITPFYQLQNGVPAYTYNVDANGIPIVPASVTSPTATPDLLETRSRVPYNQEWQLGFEREFLGWFAELDYVGNKGVKLPISYSLNQLPVSQWGPGNLQALRPYPQYSGVRLLTFDGNSFYHSLQAKLEHRWKQGFLVSAAYTFSKLIDDVDANSRAGGVAIQNIYNLRAERGVGGYDVPQRIVVNYVWELPFGRGGRFLNSTPLVKDIVAGWQFAGLSEAQVGLPLNISQTNNSGGYAAAQRPTQIAGATLDNPTIAEWLNVNAFVQTPNYRLGNAPRFPLHGPGLDNTDLSMMRNFKLPGDRRKLQFTTHFFNAWNHTQFSAVGSTLGSKTFGVVTAAQSPRVVEFLVRIYF